MGGVILIALVALLALFCARRKKQKRVAPSSEFTKYIRQPTLGRPPTQQDFQYKDVPEATDASHIQNAADYSRRDDGDMEELPSFTPGRYAGPVFEKGGYVADPNSPAHSSPTTHGSSSHQPLR